MPQSSTFSLQQGQPGRLGPIISGSSVNFCLYAPYAQSVELILYEFDEKRNLAAASDEIRLHPQQNRTGNAWHIQIDAIPDIVLYAYRIDHGDIILDPYAPEVWSGNLWGGINQTHRGQKKHYSPLSLIRRHGSFNWEGVSPPRRALRDLIIYELHVKGFTSSPFSKVQNPGTYSGLIEKIPYLKRLGINAIEFLPIQEFNELSRFESYIPTRNLLMNYWGYSPVSFLAPMNRYAASPKPGAASEEVKALVKECHRNGIEIILDVVFNHTNIEAHPTYQLDPESYYFQNQDFTGCGNTFNCNHPLAIDLIITALRHWVAEYHIDGFRFDLASVLTRDSDGTPLQNPPLIRAINADPILAHTKLIAEAWDAAGLYHVGHYPSHEGRWAEWNGQFRDECRRFIKGTDYAKGAFATRFCGSEDLYHDGRKPYHSINMVTCHDGFSLKDLVSYQEKHNEENGEQNRDGSNHNESWNCGTEGKTGDQEIRALRIRQMKNFTVALLLAQGVPLWRMGDEIAHTQMGNNNTWCQDNSLSWFHWENLEDSPFYQFVQKVMALRREFRLFRQAHFLSPDDIEWLCSWDEDDRFLGLRLVDHEEGEDIIIFFNASHTKKELHLPKGRWQVLINTYDGSSKIPATLPSYSSLVLKKLKTN